MSPGDQTLADDQALAVALARAAGQLLLVLRSTGVLVGRPLGAAGDSAANALLVTALAEHRPADGVLSEEARDDGSRLRRERVWIVDPLDGTREYGEGRDDWAVHVALTEGGTPTAAAVAIPARNRVYGETPRPATDCGRNRVYGETPRPATDCGRDRVYGETPRPADPPGSERRLRIAVSRSRPPAEAELLARTLDAELVPLGSAGVKAMAVLDGVVDVYVHAGGQYEWDSAAPVGVALAAGLHASRIDGSPLRYNAPDPLLPDLLICRPALAARLLTALAGARAGAARPQHSA